MTETSGADVHSTTVMLIGPGRRGNDARAELIERTDLRRLMALIRFFTFRPLDQEIWVQRGN